MNKVFTDSDYNSGDGMLTSVWGPSMWHTLHTISFNYPIKPDKNEKENYLNFFKNLVHILPCRYCRENYKKNLKAVPLTKNTMKNRESLSRWLFNIHEEVNKMLGKTSGLTYEDVRNRYEIFRARCIDDRKGKKKKKKSKKVVPKIESGCVKPLYGVRSKCVLSIVPKTKRCKSFNIDPKCALKR